MKTFLKTILVSLYEKKNNIYQKDVNYILTKKTYNICMKCWKMLTTELEMICRSTWALAPPSKQVFLGERHQSHAFPAEKLVWQLTHTCRRQAGWGCSHSTTEAQTPTGCRQCCHARSPCTEGDPRRTRKAGPWGEGAGDPLNRNISWKHPTQTAWVEGTQYASLGDATPPWGPWAPGDIGTKNKRPEFF